MERLQKLQSEDMERDRAAQTSQDVVLVNSDQALVSVKEKSTPEKVK